MAWYVFLPLALVAIGLAGAGIHFLVRRLGDQGLVDYIPQSPTKKSMGTAMMNFGVIYDPSLEHVIEFEQSGDLKAQGSGEPLRPDPPRDKAGEVDSAKKDSAKEDSAKEDSAGQAPGSDP